MNSHLDRLRNELETALQGVTPAMLAQSPAGKWNTEQILEHLYLSYTATTRGLNRCLEKGSPLATRPRAGLRTLLMTTTGYFPTGVNAPEITKPRGLPTDQVQGTIFAEIEAMAAKLDECEQKFGARTTLFDHPILGSMTAEQIRKVHFLHGRHHAKQIRERLQKS